jgi:2-keto-4-pentenoate hydratase/2-oxohepta-3-ene-1,7-dioic acid hydratase in catechol pathway
MRIATFMHQGRRQVGLVDAHGHRVTPLALSQAEAARGALLLVEQAARGEAPPAAAGPAMPLETVQLEAPIPLPRRNIWCVGRNYHAHAKELRETVFKNSNADPQAWPIVFTKVPECVVAPGTDVRLLPTLIETCSRGITLLPGDIIATGTPAGVGMGLNPPSWLQHGDTVVIEIDGIGRLSNRFVNG